MSTQKDNSEYDPTQLRSFPRPPAALRDLIKDVAEHIAQYGPTREFQLRAGQEGGDKYPFLYLDDEYAPYYQHKLQGARMRRRLAAAAVAAAAAAAATTTSTTIIGKDYATPRTTDSSSEHQNLTVDLFGGVFSPSRTTEGKQGAETWGFIDAIEPDHTYVQTNSCEVRIQSPQNVQSRIRQRSVTIEPEASTTQRTISTTDQHSAPTYIPYGVLQEVHLLDSTGTERSGLNTYIVLANSDTEEGDHLTAWLNRPETEYPQKEPIYRLRPDTSTVFRAPHHRLLPVGFQLGVEVQRCDNTDASIVIRRTVERGQRFYDVRDEFGEVHTDIPEDELRLHSGGHFSFRVPHTM